MQIFFACGNRIQIDDCLDLYAYHVGSWVRKESRKLKKNISSIIISSVSTV